MLDELQEAVALRPRSGLGGEIAFYYCKDSGCTYDPNLCDNPIIPRNTPQIDLDDCKFIFQKWKQEHGLE